MTSTFCKNWQETLYYLTNYPIPFSDYSWPAHHINTHNQGKSINLIVVMKFIKLFVKLHILITLSIIHCRHDLHMRPHFTYNLIYHIDILLHCITSIH
jgi:hypothetical protein